MPPKPQPRDAFELFQSHFDPLLNPAYELLQLARKPALSFEGIDWGRFEAAFAGGYSPDLGAPAKATRWMAGLQCLKYTFNESDESAVARWVENPYRQSFCGYTHLQHECPIHPTRPFDGTRSRPHGPRSKVSAAWHRRTPMWDSRGAVSTTKASLAGYDRRPGRRQHRSWCTWPVRDM